MSEYTAADWSETPKYLWPRPTLVDREFWEGARRGELRIQRCTRCGKHQHYPRFLCSHCGASNLEWVTASGNGTVYSYTVVRQNGVPPFSERVPFVVATIDLDEDGARILAAMPTVAPDDARIGMRVRAEFRPANDEFGFVDFADAGVSPADLPTAE
jgi:uncharacterized OB-fold protein